MLGDSREGQENAVDKKANQAYIMNVNMLLSIYRLNHTVRLGHCSVYGHKNIAFFIFYSRINVQTLS